MGNDQHNLSNRSMARVGSISCILYMETKDRKITPITLNERGVNMYVNFFEILMHNWNWLTTLVLMAVFGVVANIR